MFPSMESLLAALPSLPPPYLSSCCSICLIRIVLPTPGSPVLNKVSQVLTKQDYIIHTANRITCSISMWTVTLTCNQDWIFLKQKKRWKEGKTDRINRGYQFEVGSKMAEMRTSWFPIIHQCSLFNQWPRGRNQIIPDDEVTGSQIDKVTEYVAIRRRKTDAYKHLCNC